MEDFYEYAEEETARADGNQCDNDLPVWAEDTTATTGYEASTTGTVTTSGSQRHQLMMIRKLLSTQS